jgi:hypothetical protein
MSKRQVKDIVAKEKILNGTGLLYAADGKQFITAADYKFRAKTFGEVAEWGGIIGVLNELPMDTEYVLELERDDERTGKVRLESVKKRQQKSATGYEYTFKGVTPLL